MSNFHSIKFIITADFPGIKAYGIVTKETALAAKSLGFNVEVVCPEYKWSQKNLDFVVKINYVKSFLFTPLAIIQEHLWKYLRFLIFKIHVFIFSFKVRKTVLKNEIYWFRDIFSCYLISSKILRLNGMVILELHRIPSKIDLIMIKKMAPRVVLVSISEEINKYLELKMVKSQISPPAVPPRFLREKENTKQYDLGYFGSFKSYGVEKDVDILIRVLAILPPNRISSFRILYVGTGEKGKEYLTKMMSHLKLDQSTVTFINHLDYDLMPDMMSKCEFLVFPYPNHPDFIGSFPVKLLEYAASSTSILAADTNLARKLFNEDCVWFYEAQNHHDLFTIYLNALNNLEIKDAKIANSFELAKKFSYTNKVSHILNGLASSS
jgi:glycosyltransferase involved in cell wall biosynthesis